MLGRRLAITFVKDKRKADDSTPVDTMPLDQIGENIVETVAGVGTVVVVVATTLAALRVTEHVVKYIFR